MVFDTLRDYSTTVCRHYRVTSGGPFSIQRRGRNRSGPQRGNALRALGVKFPNFQNKPASADFTAQALLYTRQAHCFEASCEVYRKEDDSVCEEPTARSDPAQHGLLAKELMDILT